MSLSAFGNGQKLTGSLLLWSRMNKACIKPFLTQADIYQFITYEAHISIFYTELHIFLVLQNYKVHAWNREWLFPEYHAISLW